VRLADRREHAAGLLARLLVEPCAREGVGVEALGCVEVGALDGDGRGVALDPEQRVVVELVERDVLLAHLEHEHLVHARVRRRGSVGARGTARAGLARNLGQHDLELGLDLRPFLLRLFGRAVVDGAQRIDQPRGRESSRRARVLECVPERARAVERIEEASRLVRAQALRERGEPPVARDRLVHVRREIGEHAIGAPVLGDALLDQRDQVGAKRLRAFGRRLLALELVAATGPPEAVEKSRAHLLLEREEQALGVEQAQLEQRDPFLDAVLHDVARNAVIVVARESTRVEQPQPERLAREARIRRDRGAALETERFLGAITPQAQAAVEAGCGELEQEPGQGNPIQLPGVGDRRHRLGFGTSPALLKSAGAARPESGEAGVPAAEWLAWTSALTPFAFLLR
jgi:hypothetical protein